ncbi:MAG: hypothetical protein ACJ8AW_19855, partial [Rhodopila sp.]
MDKTVPFSRPAGRQARLATLTIVAISTQIHTAAAFPLTGEQVPQGTELAAPDTQQLRQQLDLAQGVVPPLGGGWTFLPFVNIQEML